MQKQPETNVQNSTSIKHMKILTNHQRSKNERDLISLRIKGDQKLVKKEEKEIDNSMICLIIIIKIKLILLNITRNVMEGKNK